MREPSIYTLLPCAMCVCRYGAAMRFAPDDPTVLRKYAESVCNFVMTDGARQVRPERHWLETARL